MRSWWLALGLLLALGCSSKAQRQRPLCNPPLCRASCDAPTVYGSCDPMSCPPGTAQLVCEPKVSLIACACDGRRIEIDADGAVTKILLREGDAALTTTTTTTTTTRLEHGAWLSLATTASIVAGQVPIGTDAETALCHLTVVTDGKRVDWDVPWPEVHGAEMRPFVQELVGMLPAE